MALIAKVRGRIAYPGSGMSAHPTADIGIAVASHQQEAIIGSPSDRLDRRLGGLLPPPRGGARVGILEVGRLVHEPVARYPGMRLERGGQTLPHVDEGFRR